MRTLSKVPAILSLLLLAAHFFRADQIEIAVICLLLPFTLLLHGRWVVRSMQLLLLLGSMVWLWTMVALTAVFDAIGRPSLRMMIILCAVSAFTATSAALLQISLRRASGAHQG